MGADFYEECHVDLIVVNFVDECNSLISAKPSEDKYTNGYFSLLEIYYNSQKLKINTDKTQNFVCSMPRFIDQMKHMEIITSPYIDNVKPQAQIIILGCQK